MKKFLPLSLIFFFLFTVNKAFAQPDKTLMQQRKYLTSYEKSNLSEKELPVSMPYNRWVDPAGVQICFGDKDLENHAPGCAVSPDGKWVAVEGRYSIVIIAPESKKIVSSISEKNIQINKNNRSL